MGALALIIFGSVWVSSRLAHELAMPLTELARSISLAKGDNHQPTPIGGHFAEVDEVWTRHLAVISHLRTFLENEAETKKDIAVARTAENLAHDIKNPLIAFDFAIRARNWEEFNSFRGQMTRSLTTIRTILAGFGKSAERHMIKPALTHLDLATLVDDLGRTSNANHIAVTLLGKPNFQAFVDGIAIERAIGNLVKNAAEAGAERVEISSIDNGSNLIIKVSDDGPGVPTAIIDKLFKRGTTHGKADGSGIGLHNVRAIAEGHGGSVAYSREANWTVFTIFLPHAAAPRMDAQSQAPIDPSGVVPMATVGTSTLEKTVYVGIKDEKRKAELSVVLANFGFTLSTTNMASIALLSEDDDDLDSYQAKSIRVILDDPENNPERAAQLVSKMFESIKRANIGDKPI